MKKLARFGQTLEEHLINVGKLCYENGSKFKMSNICKIVGLCHDIGKYNPQWQKYLMESIVNTNSQKINHSVEGALFLRHIFKTHLNLYVNDILTRKIISAFLPMLCNIISSHHGSLHDELIDIEGKNELYYESIIPQWFSIQNISEIDESVIKRIEECISDAIDEMIVFYKNNKNVKDSTYSYHILAKMIYSVLIDSDRTDAGQTTDEKFASFRELNDRINRYCNNFKIDSDINRIRNKIRNQCIEKGKILCHGGIYGISSQTGTGKSISSMSFAINHVCAHNLERIIYVAPFLSILEQTERVYHDIFSDIFNNIAVEDFSSSNKSNTVYVENWNKPIVLTTMVNFLNTIMSSKGSELRKLHNFSNSCIIFDEIQQLPLNCISNFNSWLNSISMTYNTTSLICTATQPILHDKRFTHNINMDIEHENIIEITDSEKDVFNSRCEYVDMSNEKHSIEYISDFISNEMKSINSFLSVVNTKSESRTLYESLTSARNNGKIDKNCEIILLNTNNTKNDRNKKIYDITELVKNKRKIICVSTNLIEAGVDLSFDRGLRLCGGEDNIIQTAGRINRHGSNVKGKLYVFNLEGENDNFDSEFKILGQLKRSKDSYIINRLYNEKIGTEHSIKGFYEDLFFGKGSSTRRNEITNIESEYPLDRDDKYNTAFKLLSNGNPLFDRLKKKVKKHTDTETALTFQYRTVSDRFRVINENITVFICNTVELKKTWNEYRELNDSISECDNKDKIRRTYSRMALLMKTIQNNSVSVCMNNERNLSEFEKYNDIYVDFDNEHYLYETGLEI